MKQNRLARTLGVVALLLGAAWSQGGAAYAVGFTPPSENSAPRTSSGGASRGSFFTPPADNSAPQGGSTGGASRGGFFTPPADSASPQSGSTGGASRGSFFVPPSDSASPQGGSTGGASRGSFFAPPSDSASPQGGSTGGASRGDAFVPPTDNGTPQGNTAGGAARSNAYGTTQQNAIEILSTGSMMAVTPDSFYGTTLEARPTILVYVPASNATEAVFSLKDEAKDLVYQMNVAVPQSGGVVAVEMPADAPELAVDQNYQWYVALMLDNELSPASPFVDGWVKRIAPTSELAERLTADDTLAKIEALGESGVWYDTVAQLAMLQEAQADEVIAGHWFELLESVGLENLAAAPLVM